MSNDGSVSAPRRSDSERRKHLRKKCFLPAKLLTTAGSFDCVVLDISHGGAKVEAGIEVANEQAVTLIAKPIGTFAGLVTWRRNGRFGMRFMAQHGTTKVSPAALAAAVGGPEKRAPEPGRETPGHSRRHDGLHAAGASPPPAESPISLRHGDLICVLRRKSGGRGSRAEVPSPVVQDTLTFGAQAFAGYRLVEMDARHFLKLIELTRGFFITLARVTSSGARRSRESDTTGQAARLTDAERAFLRRQYP